MKDINKLSQRLLAAGLSKTDTPEGLHEWQDYYGGWTYRAETVNKMVFETPCGILVKGHHFVGGHMSCAGVDWTVENDCPSILQQGSLEDGKFCFEHRA